MPGVVITAEDGELRTIKVQTDDAGSDYPEIATFAGEAAPALPTLVTRTITNATTPLLDDTDVSVTFTLVDADGQTVAIAYDATEEAYVPGGSLSVALDGGVFSVPLWPTSRASVDLWWRCTITRRGMDVLAPVTRPLAYGAGTALEYADWKETARWQ
jgi:hypothetical protein